MEEENIIPKDWKLVKLGEYVISVKGKKPKKVLTEKTKECPLPYVNIKAFEKGIIEEYTDGVGCVICEEGDFLMVWDGSRSGYVGKGIKGALGSTLVKLNFPNLDNNYAYYFLQSKYVEINTRAKGVGIPHVDPNLLWNYNLLIPPLPIQTSIVSKIEELFSELDKGIADLKTAQQQLKVYRQSVLKSAFEGKLTEDWRVEQSLDTREKLIQQLKEEKEQTAKEKGLKLKPIPSIDNEELLEHPLLPNEFSWIRLGELVWSVKDGPHYSPKYTQSGIPFISGGNIKPYGIDFSSAKYISKELHQELSQRCKPEKGDLLYTKGGTTGIARVNTYDIDFNVWVHVAVLKPLKSVNPFYLQYALNSMHCYRQSQKYTHGVGNQDLGLTRMILITLPICSLKEQEQVLLEIENRFSVADKIEESITQSLQQAEALRQSILKKAFEGKLVVHTEHAVEEKETKIIPLFPAIKENIKETDLHAAIIGKTILAHEGNQKHRSKLTHIKCEKIAHLVEYQLGISLGREPAKDAAGPDDYPHLKKVEHRANMSNWFGIKKQSIGHTYQSKPGLQKCIEKAEALLSKEELVAIDKLIQTFLPFELEHAELIATIHAGWNNLLLSGKNPTDEEIVYESRENWSDRKLKIPRENFFSTLDWMRRHNFIPEGKGKMVLKATELKPKPVTKKKKVS